MLPCKLNHAIDLEVEEAIQLSDVMVLDDLHLPLCQYLIINTKIIKSIILFGATLAHAQLALLLTSKTQLFFQRFGFL